MLAKNVDGVYSADPKLDPNAELIREISYLEVLNRELGVMDTTATSLCMDNDIPVSYTHLYPGHRGAGVYLHRQL